MKSIFNRRLATAVFFVLLVVLLVSDRSIIAAAGNVQSVQKEFVELDRQVSPTVVAVNVGIYTWSGFFISQDGLVLTTGDILRGNQGSPLPPGFGAPPPPADPASIKPKVLLASGKSYDAKVLGYDPYNNVILLKVDSTDKFPFLELGSSGTIEVGQYVATFGNVYASINNDNEVSFSVGTVTGLYRLIGTRDYKGDVVETDASVNPGGEGGPMVDLNGKVVAMACKNYALTRFQGTGVPVDQIKLVMEDLMAGKKILSGYFGATFENTVIKSVDKASPAQAAGILAGDKITEIDGVLIRNDDDVKTMLGNTPAGTTVNIFVKRGKEDLLLTVTFAKGVAGKEIQPPPPPPPPTLPPYLGITLQERQGRLVITDVAAGSPAGKAGLTAGLIILELNGEKIATIAAFEAKFSTLKPGQTIVLLVQRDDGFRKTFNIVLGVKTGKQF
jgi:serine protease Do